ncbi:MAG: YicC/YloC family endoribonuclease [Candidatus Omnitrophota bacterium]
MIKSMTGFGKSKVLFSGGCVRAEIKTFNHKYFEASSKLPDSLQIFDEQIKRIIRKRIKRGKVYLWINYEPDNGAELNFEVDFKKMQKYHQLLLQVKKRFSLSEEVTLSQLLSFPEAIVYKNERQNATLLWRHAKTALIQALMDLVRMRQKEGQMLSRDMRARAKRIKRALIRIKAYIPLEIKRFRQKLKHKFPKCLQEKNGSRREKLEMEVAIFSKNSDVTEELTRLGAHISNFNSKLIQSREAGKVLDFIAQEMQREINTVGAKSSDYKISKEVIFIKGEIEKIREQLQNIE